MLNVRKYRILQEAATPTATLTSKGQTTIPREVRRFLKLKPGDRLEFTLKPDNQTVLLKAANIHISSLRGFLKREGMKPYTPGALQKAHSKRTTDQLPVQSFQSLLADLATIVKNRVQLRDTAAAAFDLITTPTPLQQRALQLLNVRL
jgi:AbrB family looped-hinge helix DNA binding protein